MNTYENISKELKSYFLNNSFFRLILHFDMFIVYGSVGLMIVNHFVNLGSLLVSIAYYAFMLGLLLSFANDNKKILYRGLFSYSGFQLFLLLKYIILPKYRFVNFSALMAFLVFSGIGYLVFKKDSHINNTLPMK
jgi:hypothetical protein